MKRMKEFIQIGCWRVLWIYALLTIIAAIADIRENGFHSWHILYFAGAAFLAAAGFLNKPVLIAASLAAMVVIAILNGLLEGNLQWTHIAVRTLLSPDRGSCLPVCQLS